MNSHITHREIQSHATDAENRDTSVQGVWYQRYTVAIAEHQTMVPGPAEGTTTPTTAHQTATAAQNTTLRLPHHKVRRTDCLHPQERAWQYILRYQGLQSTQRQRISQQL